MAAMKNREKKALEYKSFSGNISTGQGFAIKRKQQVVKQYRKVGSKERKDLDEWSKKLKKIYEEDSSDEDEQPSKKAASRKDFKAPNLNIQSSSVPDESPPVKPSRFHRQLKQWERVKEEQEKKKQEVIVKKEEKRAATERYRKDKLRKHKLLAKKNYKGQPDMGARMQLLLEKIEKQCNS